MNDDSIDMNQVVDLANCEAELPEWERLRVRDHWDAVIAEELGAQQSPASPHAWRLIGAGERVRLRRYQRRSGSAALRLITSEADTSETPASKPGEAA